MEEDLLEACRSGDLQRINRLLTDTSSIIDINYKDKDKNTALYIAAWYGHIKIAEKLLSVTNIDINLSGENGYSPIHMAAHGGQDGIISLLLDHGADINMKDESSGQTPLLMASMGGRVDTIKYLLAKGGDLSLTSTCDLNMLHLASMYGHTEALSFLLELGFDFNATVPGYNGNTSLMFACLNGYTESAGVLVNAGADMSLVNLSGNNALENAAEEGHVDCVALLLEHGAKDQADSALQLARNRGHTEVVKLLEDLKKDDETKVTAAKASSKGGGDKRWKASPGKTKMLRPRSYANCRVYQVAKEFVKALGLSDMYFHTRYDICFCGYCYTTRGDEPYQTRGEPPKDYGLPFGWVKFGLKIPARATVERAMKTWHVAFHGTKVPNVQKILRTGDFLMPGDVTHEGTELRPPPGHYDDQVPGKAPPKGFDINKIYLSPSIEYSGCDVYAPKWRWKDSKDEEYLLRVAFQVRIEPGTYDVGPETIGASCQIDPHFPNSELEWSTKRRGVTVLVGLLVKVEGLEGGPDKKMAAETASPEPEREPRKYHKTWKKKSPRTVKVDASKGSRPKTKNHHRGPGGQAPKLAGQKATLLYPYSCPVEPGVEISLETGDRVTILDTTRDGGYIVRTPKVKKTIMIPKNFLRVKAEKSQDTNKGSSSSICALQ